MQIAIPFQAFATPARWTVIAAIVLACAGCGQVGEFDRVDRFIRDGVIAYGDEHYDEQARLVRRVDYMHAGRLSVAQPSVEYAAALLDAGQRPERAEAIINAILDHQWNKEAERLWQKGNFIWWGDEQRVRDPNAVVFLTPWLCYIAIEHGPSLSDDTRRRLAEALPRCVDPIILHPGTIFENDNHWLLRAAGLVMLSRGLDRPDLLADGEKRIDQWIEHFKTHGISEYNSPCYAAVSIFAFEWIYHYTPASAVSLGRKTVDALDFLYADVFQQWHWQAGIQAGTHSRAYPYGAERGQSLVAMLVFKQCGGPQRMPIRAFEYVFAVNDYRVSDAIRRYAEKTGRLPLWLQTSHAVFNTSQRVERSVYIAPEVSLATQTGRRPMGEQDVIFKITYAGSKAEQRASFMRASPIHVPGRYAVQPAALQQGSAAIVLYELDMKGVAATGRMLLEITQDPERMIDEMIVEGRPYDGERLELSAGDVVGWRVGDGMVAIRLLESAGLASAGTGAPGAVPDILATIPSAGLCLDCLLTGEASKRVAADNLSCGFVVRVASRGEFSDLAGLVKAVQSWPLIEQRSGLTRDIAWQTPGNALQLVWDSSRHVAITREINGRPCPPHPRYNSPLIQLEAGDPPRVTSAPGP